LFIDIFLLIHQFSLSDIISKSLEINHIFSVSQIISVPAVILVKTLPQTGVSITKFLVKDTQSAHSKNQNMEP